MTTEPRRLRLAPDIFEQPARIDIPGVIGCSTSCPGLWPARSCVFSGAPSITGLEFIPPEGGAILASNHLSIVDSIFLPLMLDRPLTFAAKSEYFTGRSVAQRLAGTYLRATKQLSVDRAQARAGQDMLEAALALLRSGQLFGIYPEGTRSPDGRLYRGRTGVAWLAMNSGLPVIPVAMMGTDRILPPGHAVPRLHQVSMRIGKPLTFEAYQGTAPGKARRAITDEVIQAIQDLSGQEYVPMYASVRKAELNGQASRRGVSTPPVPPGRVGAASPGASLPAAAPRGRPPWGRTDSTSTWAGCPRPPRPDPLPAGGSSPGGGPSRSGNGLWLFGLRRTSPEAVMGGGPGQPPAVAGRRPASPASSRVPSPAPRPPAPRPPAPAPAAVRRRPPGRRAAAEPSGSGRSRARPSTAVRWQASRPAPRAGGQGLGAAHRVQPVRGPERTHRGGRGVARPAQRPKRPRRLRRSPGSSRRRSRAPHRGGLKHASRRCPRPDPGGPRPRSAALARAGPVPGRPGPRHRFTGRGRSGCARRPGAPNARSSRGEPPEAGG